MSQLREDIANLRQGIQSGSQALSELDIVATGDAVTDLSLIAAALTGVVRILVDQMTAQWAAIDLLVAAHEASNE